MIALLRPRETGGISGLVVATRLWVHGRRDIGRKNFGH
jgi:hypothetical protein